jgi:putative acetyltransferase
MSTKIATAAFAIRRAALSSPQAQVLIGALNVELAAMYPEPGANHFRLDAEDVTASNGAFLIGYLGDEPVACGAIRRTADDCAEIKRMYVTPAARGRGFSKLMLAALQEHARVLGFQRVVLETGVRQFAALALYGGAGFKTVARFGEYADSPLSVCMSKELI